MAWHREPNIYRSIRIHFIVALWLTVALGCVLLLSMHPATYVASLYLALSHFAHALANWNKGRRSWLDR